MMSLCGRGIGEEAEAADAGTVGVFGGGGGRGGGGGAGAAAGRRVLVHRRCHHQQVGVGYGPVLPSGPPPLPHVIHHIVQRPISPLSAS